jgi:hypothetical protein
MVNILTYLHHRSTHSQLTLSQTSHHFTMEKLIFTPQQTNNLPFPIGCPVWYFPNSGIEENGGYSIVQGVISEVSMDLKRGMTIGYTVTHKGKIVGESLPEKDLAYAFQCPVVVRAENSGEWIDAMVLQAKIVDGRVVYTVMHEAGGGFTAYKEGIWGEKVKYRSNVDSKASQTEKMEEKVAVVANVARVPDQVDENQEPPLSEVTCPSVGRSVFSGRSKDTSASAAGSRKANNDRSTEQAAKAAPPTPAKSLQSGCESGEILEGATRGYNNLKPSPNASMESPGLRRLDSMASPDELEFAAKRAKLLNETGEKHPTFEIELPIWLQQNKDMRDKLYGE